LKSVSCQETCNCAFLLASDEYSYECYSSHYCSKLKYIAEHFEVICKRFSVLDLIVLH
jgi:hypothetical protein